MAQQRVHLLGFDADRQTRVFVEFPDNASGEAMAALFRAQMPELFKGKRIKRVLQMNPSEVPIGALVDVTA